MSDSPVSKKIINELGVCQNTSRSFSHLIHWEYKKPNRYIFLFNFTLVSTVFVFVQLFYFFWRILLTWFGIYVSRHCVFDFFFYTVLVCDSDLFLPNQFKTIEQRYTSFVFLKVNMFAFWSVGQLFSMSVMYVYIVQLRYPSYWM